MEASLDSSKVRVRFAPSPTGYLHIGGARTALFNWLYAKHTGGTFVLRIEDTDAARNSLEAVEVILRGLRWLGLDWDEGPTTAAADGPSKGDRGPYFQSRRGEVYQKYVKDLIEKGAAYEQEGAIKFRMERNPILINDLVVGEVTRRLTDREEVDPDFVIVRSDGQPVFHLVNVVDDLAMGITHVIRGEDHLSNTPKHIALFKAFGAQPPAYAHIPLILNPNGTKMSKRDQGASLTSYENEGYMPEAVVNYLCLLGWSPKGNREIISLPEVAQIFDLPQILRHNARFDLEKLKWVNWEYIKAMPLGNFSVMALKALNKAGMLEKWAAAAKIMDVLRMGTLDAVRCFADSLSTDPDLAHAQDALATCKEKVKLFPEVPAFAGFYFRADFSYEEEPMRKNFNAENRPRVEKLREALAAAAAFDAGTLEAVLKKVAAEFGVKASVLVQPTRLACTGKMVGPSLYHLMEVLGRDEVLRRFDRALKWPGLGRGDLEQSR